jgi:hypothetical protein
VDTDLPEFDKRPQYIVLPYTKSIFAGNFIRLEEFDDGHFRVVFKSTYFVLQEEQTEPSKSQWSTLKKKMKRHNKGVFVFKETGGVDCEAVTADYACYYVDFGFFAYER